ncbi:transposable element Tcb1 transposase [Trichonephila clavipes]|nr:transposable element Tcb1 transposase [Trichonephila clavipes]
MIHPCEKDAYSVYVWGGISLEERTDLHVNVQIYRDDILDAYVHPHAEVIGDDSVQLDDNAREHRARIADAYLEPEAIQPMKNHIIILWCNFKKLKTTHFKFFSNRIRDLS